MVVIIIVAPLLTIAHDVERQSLEAFLLKDDNVVCHLDGQLLQRLWQEACNCCQLPGEEERGGGGGGGTEAQSHTMRQ